MYLKNHKAFTMVELIFVIVIIGVLAAVAIPKLTGIFGQSKVSKIVAYAGTLQRTTIPPYWSQSIMGGTNGEINATVPGSTDTYGDRILADLDYPTDFDGTGTTPVFNTANLEVVGYTFVDGTLGSKKIAISEALNGITYTLVCSNGNKSTAPACDVYDGSKWILKNNR